MKNLAAIVSKKAIQQALEEAYTKKLKLYPATKFHIIYKDTPFPPKEIVRLAAKKEGITNIDSYRLAGGKSVNQHLIKKGFVIEQFANWAARPKSDQTQAAITRLLNFSKNDYVKALQSKKVLNERRTSVLNAFANFPNYTACSRDIAAIINTKPNFVNLIFGQLAKAVSLCFNITDPATFNSSDWWPILATGKREANAFYWTLKRPFVAALLQLKVISTGNLYPDEITNTKKSYEGGRKSVMVNKYERDSVARNECINHYGIQCQVCNIDFKKNYGNAGIGFIHVHHVIKIADRGGKKYQVDPVKDLRPVCPNCHAMLHREDPPITIEELKKRIRYKYT